MLHPNTINFLWWADKHCLINRISNISVYLLIYRKKLLKCPSGHLNNSVKSLTKIQYLEYDVNDNIPTNPQSNTIQYDFHGLS